MVPLHAPRIMAFCYRQVREHLSPVLGGLEIGSWDYNAFTNYAASSSFFDSDPSLLDESHFTSIVRQGDLPSGSP